MSQEDVIGAGSFVTFDNIEYKIRRINDKDIALLNEWVRGRIVSIARSSLEGVEDEFTRQETLSAAITKAMSTSWMYGDGAKMMASPEGLARIIWQAMQGVDDRLSYEDMRGLMLIPEHVNEVTRSLHIIKPKRPPTAGGSTSTGGGKPDRRHQKSKRRRKR